MHASPLTNNQRASQNSNVGQGAGLGPTVFGPAEFALVLPKVRDLLAACAAPAIVPAILPVGALRAPRRNFTVCLYGMGTGRCGLGAWTKALHGVAGVPICHVFKYIPMKLRMHWCDYANTPQELQPMAREALHASAYAFPPSGASPQNSCGTWHSTPLQSGIAPAGLSRTRISWVRQILQGNPL